MRNPKSLYSLLICAFVALSVYVPQAQAEGLTLPAPGTMVHLSPAFNPPVLKGIKVHPENPFRFDFILDRGSESSSIDASSVAGEASSEAASSFEAKSASTLAKKSALKAESTKLIKYFLASLTIPEKDLWVNLSPYEKDRIVPDAFGQTAMGRDLLAQDYLLKQITASLLYPEDETGKKFWNRIYAEAARKFKITNVPVNTFNKVWIVPEKAVVYENAQAGTAYVVESRLKVMLEQDYLSLQKNTAKSKQPVNDVNALGSQVVREVVIPQLTKEINEGRNFSQLRQVYSSLILAVWYKQKIKDSILGKIYADQSKVAGIVIDDRQEKQRIYDRYLEAFKRGAYNYIKEETDAVSRKPVPRKYFSGGLTMHIPRIDYAMAGDVPDASGEQISVRLAPADAAATNGLAPFDKAMAAPGVLQMPLEQEDMNALAREVWRDAGNYSSVSGDLRFLAVEYMAEHFMELDPDVLKHVETYLVRRSSAISMRYAGLVLGSPFADLAEFRPAAEKMLRHPWSDPRSKLKYVSIPGILRFHDRLFGDLLSQVQAFLAAGDPPEEDILPAALAILRHGEIFPAEAADTNAQLVTRRFRYALSMPGGTRGDSKHFDLYQILDLVFAHWDAAESMGLADVKAKAINAWHQMASNPPSVTYSEPRKYPYISVKRDPSLPSRFFAALLRQKYPAVLTPYIPAEAMSQLPGRSSIHIQAATGKPVLIFKFYKSRMDPDNMQVRATADQVISLLHGHLRYDILLPDQETEPILLRFGVADDKSDFDAEKKFLQGLVDRVVELKSERPQVKTTQDQASVSNAGVSVDKQPSPDQAGISLVAKYTAGLPLTWDELVWAYGDRGLYSIINSLGSDLFDHSAVLELEHLQRGPDFVRRCRDMVDLQGVVRELLEKSPGLRPVLRSAFVYSSEAFVEQMKMLKNDQSLMEHMDKATGILHVKAWAEAQGFKLPQIHLSAPQPAFVNASVGFIKSARKAGLTPADIDVWNTDPEITAHRMAPYRIVASSKEDRAAVLISFGAHYEYREEEHHLMLPIYPYKADLAHENGAIAAALEGTHNKRPTVIFASIPPKDLAGLPLLEEVLSLPDERRPRVIIAGLSVTQGLMNTLTALTQKHGLLQVVRRDFREPRVPQADVEILETTYELNSLYGLHGLTVLGEDRNIDEPLQRGMPVIYMRGKWKENRQALLLARASGAAVPLDGDSLSQVEDMLNHPDVWRARVDHARQHFQEFVSPGKDFVTALAVANVVNGWWKGQGIYRRSDEAMSAKEKIGEDAAMNAGKHTTGESIKLYVGGGDPYFSGKEAYPARLQRVSRANPLTESEVNRLPPTGAKTDDILRRAAQVDSISYTVRSEERGLLLAYIVAVPENTKISDGSPRKLYVFASAANASFDGAFERLFYRVVTEARQGRYTHLTFNLRSQGINSQVYKLAYLGRISRFIADVEQYAFIQHPVGRDISQYVKRQEEMDIRIARLNEVRDRQAWEKELKGLVASHPKAAIEIEVPLLRNTPRMEVLAQKADVNYRFARRLADFIVENNKRQLKSVVILPTGGTQEGFYQQFVDIVKEERIELSRLVTFNMDEYYVGPGYGGDWGQNEQSYGQYMEKHLFGRLRSLNQGWSDGNANFLNGNAGDVVEEAQRLEAKMREEGGVDLAFGGIGRDGHVAFNEPIITIGPNFNYKDPEQIKKVRDFNEFSVEGGAEDIERIVRMHMESRQTDILGKQLAEEFVRAGKPRSEVEIAGLVEKLQKQKLTVYLDDQQYAQLPEISARIKDLLPDPELIAFERAGNIARSRTRLVQLAIPTIVDNGRYFDDARAIPVQALTIGIGTLMDAKEIMIAATGANKAEAVFDALRRPVSSEVSASYLQGHPGATFVLDQPAAQEVNDGVATDAAMGAENTGGIDLTSNKALVVENDGPAIQFHINPVQLRQLQNAPGFTPVIINIQPLADVRFFLGIHGKNASSKIAVI